MKNVVMARLMAKGHVIQKASPSVHMGSLLGHSLQRSLQKTVSSPSKSKILLQFHIRIMHLSLWKLGMAARGNQVT